MLAFTHHCHLVMKTCFFCLCMFLFVPLPAQVGVLPKPFRCVCEKHGNAMTLYAWSHFGWKLESQNEATTNHRLNDCWHQESKIVLFLLKHLMWKVMKRLWKGCQKVKLLEVLIIQVFKLIGQNHICISLQICSLFPSFKQRTTDISQTLSQRHGWHGWHGYITWQSEDGATRSL